MFGKGVGLRSVNCIMLGIRHGFSFGLEKPDNTKTRPVFGLAPKMASAGVFVL